jgi:hypothetical protein
MMGTFSSTVLVTARHILAAAVLPHVLRHRLPVSNFSGASCTRTTRANG